jgi:hypothetical protein
MADANRQELSLLPKLVIASAVLLLAAGVLWYGITVEVVLRIFRDLFNRPSEPMSFRFILQPVMALIAALRDGIKDARTGRSPYFWTIMSEPGKRAGRLREGLNATARILLLGLVMDVIYQIMVLKRFYPAEAVIIAVMLAFVPYFFMRGPIARIARRWYGRGRTA